MDWVWTAKIRVPGRRAVTTRHSICGSVAAAAAAAGVAGRVARGSWCFSGYYVLAHDALVHRWPLFGGS